MADKKAQYEPCKKCTYKSLPVCCYGHYLSDDKLTCSAMVKSAYWVKKDREDEQAKLLGMLLNEKGVVPKYKLGDRVYHIMWHMDLPEVLEIRQIEVRNDLTYRYKVKGHTEYAYEENNLYATESECMNAIVNNLIADTKRRVENIRHHCRNRGIDYSKFNILQALDNGRQETSARAILQGS